MAEAEERALWNHWRLGYTEAPGMPALPKTVAQGLYPGLEPDNIFMFAGTEEGIFCALNVMVTEGDHVIVLTPCYQ